jgi:hypothetical protein
MSFDVIYTETSGSHYTPTEVVRFAVAGVPSARQVARHNTGRLPNTQNIELKITKEFTLVQKYRMSAFIVVTNLLNAKNAANVFTSTGLTNDDGFLAYAGSLMTDREMQQYNINLNDNFNLEPPRQIECGFTIEF